MIGNWGVEVGEQVSYIDFNTRAYTAALQLTQGGELVRGGKFGETKLASLKKNKNKSQLPASANAALNAASKPFVN